LSRRAIDMHLFRRRRPARLPAAFRAIVEEAPDERLRGDARSDDSIRLAARVKWPPKSQRNPVKKRIFVIAITARAPRRP